MNLWSKTGAKVAAAMLALATGIGCDSPERRSGDSLVGARPSDPSVEEIRGEQEPGTRVGPARGGRALPSPDLGGRDALARAQIEERRRWLGWVLEKDTVSAAQKAESIGEVGKLYHAYDYPEAAAAYYREAERRSPEDARWPYYLGQVHRMANRLDLSIASFERALEIERDVPTLVRLGEVLIDQDRYDEAETFLCRALEIDPNCAAALLSLGHIALSRRDLGAAVERFEEVLRLQPGASKVRYPLAMAYRDLGRTDRAESHLAAVGEVEVRLRDPKMLEIYQLADGMRQALARGDAAAAEERLEGAARAYQEAVVADPLFSAPRLQLGRSLLLLGELEAAEQQLDRALLLAPDDPAVLLACAVVHERVGRAARSVELYRQGLAGDPENRSARLDLALLLLRLERHAEAAQEFAELLNIEPGHRLAQLGVVTALQNAGRCREARTEIESALAARPRDATFGHALARILASCPDDSVRDGRRALELASSLFQRFPTPEHEEALAMALAEVGRFAEAARRQQAAIARASREGRNEGAARLSGNLVLFENERPCRTPWVDLRMFVGG